MFGLKMTSIPSAPNCAFKTCMIALMLVPKFCVKFETCMVDLFVGLKFCITHERFSKT